MQQCPFIKEIIPKEQPCKPPLKDKPIPLITKWFHPQSPRSSIHQQRHSHHSSTNAQPREKQIQQLKIQLKKEQEKNHLQSEANRAYSHIMEKIKQIMYRKKGYQFEIKLEDIANQLQNLLTQQLEPQKRNQNQYDKVIQDQGTKIQQLRDKLLQSTQNNINAIFNTQLSSQELLSREVACLRKEVISIAQKNHYEAIAAAREERLQNLVKNYEHFLAQYKHKEEIIKVLQNGQQTTNKNFIELRNQLLSTVEQTCHSKYGEKLKQIQNRLIGAIEEISIPEKVQPEAQEQENRGLLKQIQHLNNLLYERQKTIEKLKNFNIQLQAKLVTQQSSALDQYKMNLLDERIKEKEQRILKLQNTIIDHIESKTKLNQSDKEDSFDSERSTKNYKVIIKSLKSQIKQLKYKIRNITMTSDNMTSFEKISQDELVEELLGDILLVLLDQRTSNENCTCLDRITDMMLENFPDFQDVLINHGIIQTSSNIISLNINQPIAI